MTTDHVKMLCDIGELNGLFEESSLEDLLQKIVNMVADHMLADVCSVYIFDESTNELVLKATKGLKQESVDEIRLKPGEGLVGMAMKDRIPICEKCADDSPYYKFYPNSNEELYESFLAVPIMRGSIPIGVLAVQRGDDHYFVENDVLALKATASQLASMLENIRFLIAANRPGDLGQEKCQTCLNLDDFKFIKGKTASCGSIKSTVKIYDSRFNYHDLKEKIKNKKFTQSDLDKALINTENQLEELQNKVEEKLSDAASLIFESHLLMLKDKGFLGKIHEFIDKGVNPPEAVYSAFLKYKEIFLNSESQIIKEKVQDIEDLTLRIIQNLLKKNDDIDEFSGHIIISKELYPSDLLKLSAEKIDGIILISGGLTSHVSILARSLKIPLVYTDNFDLLKIPQGTEALLDADQGNIYFNPSNEILSKFKKRNKARKDLEKLDKKLRGPARTKDGVDIKVKLNVNLLSDVTEIGIKEIDGVGLYRTEFPFMIRNSFPSEEEQYVIYRKLITSLKGKPVVFRTLDIGGDKVLSYYDFPKEDNPFLGMRSIRFSLTHEEIFLQQIRALLRAGENCPIKIMFPMISSIDEYIQAKEVVDHAIKELKREKIPHNENPDLGVMIEIPSIVNVIEELAQEVGFFSIGTNDLIQYTLAVDRTNEKVADLYVPHHPSILRSLSRISEAANNAGIDVTVCGDMANDERYIPFLLGIGIKSLSVDAIFIPRVKRTIAGIVYEKTVKDSKKIIGMDRISKIEAFFEA